MHLCLQLVILTVTYRQHNGGPRRSRDSISSRQTSLTRGALQDEETDISSNRSSVMVTQ